MRVGVLLLPTDPWPVAVARARHLEALGFDHLWTYDHLSWRRYRDRPWHESLVWLTGLAGVTSRIRLGTMVASPHLRHPAPLAKAAVTLDHVSGGRFTLGVGAGGEGFDATVLGAPTLSPGERAARLADFVAALDRLLREPLVSHSGDWYEVVEARMLPESVQRPRVPLAVAAEGRRTVEVAVGHADAWISHGVGLSARERAWADEALARIGRDPASLDRIYLAGVTEDRPLASVAAFADFAGRAAAAGFTDLVLHDPRPDDPVWAAPEGILDEIAGTWPR